MKKQLLFLLITSILPLAASLPPENFSENSLKIAKAMHKRGYMADQYLENLYEEADSVALTHLGVSQQGKDCVKEIPKKVAAANNFAKTVPGQKTHFADNVPAEVRDAVTKTREQQDIHLPISVEMTPATGGRNMETAFFKPNNLRDVQTELIDKAKNNEPIAVLQIGADYLPETLEANLTHEGHHVLRGDSLKNFAIMNDLWQKTKAEDNIEQSPDYQALSPRERKELYQTFCNEVEQDPDYQAHQRVQESSADTPIYRNEKLIKQGQKYYKTILQEDPDRTEHGSRPSDRERLERLKIMKDVKRAERFLLNNYSLNNNNNNSLATQNPAKHQRQS